MNEPFAHMNGSMDRFLPLTGASRHSVHIFWSLIESISGIAKGPVDLEPKTNPMLIKP